MVYERGMKPAKRCALYMVYSRLSGSFTNALISNMNFCLFRVGGSPSCLDKGLQTE